MPIIMTFEKCEHNIIFGAKRRFETELLFFGLFSTVTCSSILTISAFQHSCADTAAIHDDDDGGDGDRMDIAFNICAGVCVTFCSESDIVMFLREFRIKFLA